MVDFTAVDIPHKCHLATVLFDEFWNIVGCHRTLNFSDVLFDQIKSSDYFFGFNGGTAGVQCFLYSGGNLL